MDVAHPGAYPPRLDEPVHPGDPVVPRGRVSQAVVGDRRDVGQRAEKRGGVDPGAGALGPAVDEGVADPAARRTRLQHDPGRARRPQARRRAFGVRPHRAGQVLSVGADRADFAPPLPQVDARAGRAEADADLGAVGNQVEDRAEACDPAVEGMVAVVPHALPEETRGHGDGDSRRPHASSLIPRPVEPLADRIAACRACERLVTHREEVARRPPKRFAGERYWARAVPSFGVENPRLLVVGLAPAAHGANRTGRMFTGDRSGEWLFEALHRFGFADRPVSERSGDGLRLLDARVTAVCHCAPPDNRPLGDELRACRPFLLEEIARSTHLEVVLVLGAVAHAGFLRAFAESGRPLPRPKPRFGHGASARLPGGPVLLSSFHPSQQNTFTGRLTRPAFHAVFRDARARLDS